MNVIFVRAMKTGRPKPVSLEAEIDALTRLVIDENRVILSSLVTDVLESIELRDFERVAELSLTAITYAHAGFVPSASRAPSRDVMVYFYTIHWWARAIAALKATDRLGRWSLRRGFLRWYAGRMAEQAYRARQDARESDPRRIIVH